MLFFAFSALGFSDLAFSGLGFSDLALATGGGA
jgi:hypothetical protein